MSIAERAVLLRGNKIIGGDLNLLIELQYSYIHPMEHSHGDGQFVNTLHGEVCLSVQPNGFLRFEEFSRGTNLSLSFLGNSRKSFLQIRRRCRFSKSIPTNENDNQTK